MTLKVAITGGIGSGKSFVCRLLEQRGIKIYDCDDAAKRLMRTSEQLQHNLSSLVGQQLFIDGVLQKKLLTKFLLQSESHKQAVNDIVHPAVAADFLTSGYSWLESAILFESGFDRRVPFDKIVCVTAPEDVRIKRVMQRDCISEQQARMWVQGQMRQEEIVSRSHFTIINDGCAALDSQISDLLKKLNQ